ncbi:hypothetical protein ACHAXS_013546 [Conticribra weissflogii]
MATSSRISLHAIQAAQRHRQRQLRYLSTQSSSELLCRTLDFTSKGGYPAKRREGFRFFSIITSTTTTNAQPDGNVSCTEPHLGKTFLEEIEISIGAKTCGASGAIGADDVGEKYPTHEYRDRDGNASGKGPPKPADSSDSVSNEFDKISGLMQTNLPGDRRGKRIKSKRGKKVKARPNGTKDEVTTKKNFHDLADDSDSDGPSKSNPRKSKATKNRIENIHRRFAASDKNTVPSSEWLLVTNIPMMSQLSDILPGLSKIVEFELQKGIIDLDALEGSETPTDISHEHGEIPLWKSPGSIPTFSSVFNEKPLPPHMVLEARILLSYRARPVGWFLRFPNRSVVNAILNHFEEAKRRQIESNTITKRFGEKESLEKHLKQRRYRWRDRLWKEVLGNVRHESDRKGAQGEGHDMELLQGRQDIIDAMGRNETSDNEEENNANSDECEYSLSSGRSLPSHLVDPILLRGENMEGYHLLKCGMETLNVREFKPRKFDDAMPSDDENKNGDNSWAQHFFHLGPSLDLSDSVIRVDIDGRDKPSLDEIKYFFRAYDMKGIYPVDTTSDDTAEIPSTTPVPTIYSESAQSIGWTLPPKIDDGQFLSPQSNVDFLIRGFGHMKFDERGENENSNLLLNSSVKRPYKSSFLVRLASPAEARMAVREKLGVEFMGSRIMVSQFPRQDVGI